MNAPSHDGAAALAAVAAPPVSRDLKEAVLQLFEDYADAMDAQDLEAWPGFFTEDCRYVVTSRENHDAGLPHATIYCEGLGMVRDRAAATRDCTVYEPRHLRHFIHGLRVHRAGDGLLSSKASVLVIESVSDREPTVLVVGQYVDLIAETPAGLKLKERTVVYDNYRIYNSLVFPI